MLDRQANAIDATMQRQSRYIKKASFSLGASLFITLFLLPLESPCQTTDNNKSSKVTLTGEIGHASKLKPIEPALKAGSRFDKRILNQFMPQDYWYQIPGWLAGIWQRNDQNLLKQKSLTFSAKLKSTLYPPRMGKFKSQVKYRWGYQFDRAGNVWNYAKFPYIVKVDGANTYTVQVVREATPVSVTNKVVSLKFRSTSHKIDKRTNMILFAEQAEAISMFAKYEPNTLYVRYSRKVFDDNGSAKFIQESDSFIPRVAKFFPKNVVGGKDLRVSLRNYLLAHNPQLAPVIVSPAYAPQPGNRMPQRSNHPMPGQYYRNARPNANYYPAPFMRPQVRPMPSFNQAYPASRPEPVKPKKPTPVPSSHQPPAVELGVKTDKKSKPETESPSD